MASQCYHYMMAFLLAFGIIISSTTVFSVDSRKTSILMTLMSVIAFLFLGLLEKKRRIPVVGIITLLLYYPSMFLTLRFVTTPDMTTYYINFMLLLPAVFFLFCFMTEEERKRAMTVFVLTVTVIGAVSILLFYAMQFRILHPTGFWVSKWLVPPQSVAHFHHLQYLSQPGRNTSFFPEAPAYNYLLGTALLCNAALTKYKPLLVNTILIATILTTATMTGQIVITALIVAWIASMPARKPLVKLMMILVVMIAFVIAALYLQQIMEAKMGGHSASVRSSKLLEEVEAFLQSPLLGHGLGSYSSGSSNSVTSLLADGGIVIWGLYYFPIIGIFCRDLLLYKKVNYFVLIYAAMFAVCVFQYFTLSLLATAFLWYRLLVRQPKKTSSAWKDSKALQPVIKALTANGKE